MWPHSKWVGRRCPVDGSMTCFGESSRARSRDANHQPCQGLPGHRHRQRRLGRHGGVEPDEQGHRRPAARCRRRSSIAANTGRTSGRGRRASVRRAASAAAVLPRHEGAAVPHAAAVVSSTSTACGATAARRTSGAASASGCRTSTSRAPEADGWEIPWPISYKDIAPYYDQVEQLIGVCGGTDDSDSLPGSKFLQPPPAPRCGERLLQKAARERRHPDRRRPARQHDEADARLSALPLLRRLRRPAATPPRSSTPPITCCPSRSRPATWRSDRTPSWRGFSSTTTASRRASSTSIARRGAEQQVLGKVVVLGASTVDSTRILLNSTSEQLSERHRQRLRRHRPLPVRADPLPRPRLSCRSSSARRHGTIAASAASTSTCRASTTAPGRKRDYLRGFGAQFWNTGASAAGAHGGSELIPGFGASLKQEIKRRHPAWFEIHPYGEVLPYAHNRITVDGIARIATACRCRTSTIASATTSGRWPST